MAARVWDPQTRQILDAVIAKPRTTADRDMRAIADQATLQRTFRRLEARGLIRSVETVNSARKLWMRAG